MLGGGDTPDLGPGSELHRRIEELASLRDEGELTPELPQDVAALETVLLRAVKERLADDPGALVDAVERLIKLFSLIQSGLVGNSSPRGRASSSGSPTPTR